MIQDPSSNNFKSHKLMNLCTERIYELLCCMHQYSTDLSDIRPSMKKKENNRMLGLQQYLFSSSFI